jgi:Rrf2 family protein
MKISAKVRYAIRTLVEIGKCPGNSLPLSIVEKNQNISSKFAKQFLQPLEEKNIVGSKRGAKGGYFLKKDPSEIRLLDVVEALEKEIQIVPCIKDTEFCERKDFCGAKGKWEEFQNLIKDFYYRTTIQDIIEQETK